MVIKWVQEVNLKKIHFRTQKLTFLVRNVGGFFLFKPMEYVPDASGTYIYMVFTSFRG